MDFLTLAKERCSIKKFDGTKMVEDDKLSLILEAGRVAPTAKNNQPQRIYVVRSEEKLKALAELTPCLYGSKTVLVIGYNQEEEWHNPVEEGIVSGIEDASIVATHMMLEAYSIGIDSCWVNFYPNSKVEKALGLPAAFKSVLLLPLGYRAEGAGPLANHTSKKPLEETVSYL